MLTTKSLKDLYVLVFLHIGTRQVFVSTSTYHPDEAWVIGQADEFKSYFEARGKKPMLTFTEQMSSAALWIGSGADYIVAANEALANSGIITTDYSKRCHKYVPNPISTYYRSITTSGIPISHLMFPANETGEKSH